MGIERKKQEWIFFIPQGKISSASVCTIVTLNLSGNKPQEGEISLEKNTSLFLFLPFVHFLLCLFLLPLPPPPPLSSLLPLSLPPSSFFLPLPPSFLLPLSLIKLLIIKIWSLLGLWSQSLIFKLRNYLVYTKLNLLAFYFCGIWHQDGTAFHLLQVSAVFSLVPLRVLNLLTAATKASLSANNSSLGNSASQCPVTQKS